jgi:hypothetical protein
MPRRFRTRTPPAVKVANKVIRKATRPKKRP